MPRVIFECDGCKKQEEGWWGADRNAHKPEHWYQRSDTDGVQLACSRECIDKVSKSSGKTRVVLPI